MSVAPATRPPFAEATRGLLRDSVLDALGELLAADAWSDVTMAEVATRAGVSRQTLYNAFGNREELAQANLMREAERFLAAIENAVSSNVDDPRRALTSAAELFLSLVSSHPMVRAISTQEGEQLVAMATTRGGALLTAMTDRLSELILANWPEVDPGGARLLSATLVRLAISHAVLPTGEPEHTAAEIARILGPYIDELLTEDVGI
ncbi:MAG: TetR/AcrR family transcriptional regulator [Solirubrobacterales bacterium]|nr:TetR/AcrR family transcriptional regulator [Solirubrobacterales bacterium]